MAELPGKKAVRKGDGERGKILDQLESLDRKAVSASPFRLSID